MPASTHISIDQAKPDKLFYFVANCVVYRASDGRCLILKRDQREKVHPGKYGIPGGKLEWADFDVSKPSYTSNDVMTFDNAIENLLHREVREEAGIEISDDLRYLKSVTFIRPDGVPVIFVSFAGLYQSGEVVPEPGAFTDFAWVNAEEVKQYDCIEGIGQEIAQTIELFNHLI